MFVPSPLCIDLTISLGRGSMSK